MTDAPAAPTTPTEAATRLDQLKSDPAWRDQFLAGNGPQVAEFKSLSELLAKGDDIDLAMSGALADGPFQPPGYAVNSGTAAMLREAGFPEKAVREVLARDAVTQIDVDRATQWKTRAMSTKEYTDRLLAGDHDARREMLAANAVLSAPLKTDDNPSGRSRSF